MIHGERIHSRSERLTYSAELVISICILKLPRLSHKERNAFRQILSDSHDFLSGTHCVHDTMIQFTSRLFYIVFPCILLRLEVLKFATL
jgi:hypothetical protein